MDLPNDPNISRREEASNASTPPAVPEVPPVTSDIPSVKESPQAADQQPSVDNLILKVGGIGAVVLLIAFLGFAAFYYFQFLRSAPSDGGGAVELKEGFIYLSLIPEENDGSVPLGMYTYDVEEEEFDKFLLNDSQGKHTFTGRISPKGTHIVYVSQDSSETQLFVFDVGTEEKLQITKSPLRDKRSPVWSPDGDMIAFNALGDSDEVNYYPDNWDVYVTDLDGNERKLGSGIYPQFGPEGKYVLVLRNDGLYVYNANGLEEGRRVWAMQGGIAHITMKLGLSQDKKILAWSIPTSGEILIFKVFSWDPFFKAYIFDTITDTSAFWPVFSPGGSFLVFEEVDWIKGPHNPRLVLYDLTDKTKKLLYDLSSYDPLALWIDDWR